MDALGRGPGEGNLFGRVRSLSAPPAECWQGVSEVKAFTLNGKV
jgi:hypothetical protein